MVWSEWVLLVLGILAGGWIAMEVRRHLGDSVSNRLKRHFGRKAIESFSISTRSFPYRVRADLQCCLNELLEQRPPDYLVSAYTSDRATSISECLHGHDVHTVPAIYESVEIGEETPFKVLSYGLCLTRHEDIAVAILFAPESGCGANGIRVEIATDDSDAAQLVAERLFRRFEDTVTKAPCYRGKILSLENNEYDYTGMSAGIKVHQLRDVSREDIVLPEKTLDLLDRNIVRFVSNRDQLTRLGQSTKKGVLFYGPPGTGKTHTLHYLAKSLPQHTTLIVTAEQIGMIGQYMQLARLLQPCVLFIEDADLIARSREYLGVDQEVLLNKLLNEMDGLHEDAKIMFILTTNRPSVLEAALAARPGRVDQAIEFPLPDEQCRERLVAMYSGDLSFSTDIVQEIVSRTEGVSSSFIKELMRRTAQFSIERNANGQVAMQDVHLALDELLHSSGVLNLKILGYAEGT